MMPLPFFGNTWAPVLVDEEYQIKKVLTCMKSIVDKIDPSSKQSAYETHQLDAIIRRACAPAWEWARRHR